MDKLQTMDVPADILPTSQTQRYGNQFHSRQSFPFQSYSTIPSFSVVVENILLSCGTIFASIAGLFVTMTVFLPLGILKSFVGMIARIAGYSKKRRYQNVSGTKRCVVINGARYVTVLQPELYVKPTYLQLWYWCHSCQRIRCNWDTFCAHC